MEKYPCLSISRNGDALNVELNKVLDRGNGKTTLALIQNQLDEKIKTIVFDASKLKYISADGLDVILELKKSHYNILLDNACVGIYDTLSLYGFDNFVDINKQYRMVSTDGCKIIGQGGHGIIYKIGEDTIIKVYKDHSPIEIIEKERQYAKNAFVNGISTAIAYDVVETKQGYGVIFEMINGMTLGKYLSEHPDELDKYSVKFADLLHTLHATDADKTLYEDFEELLLERIETLRKYLKDEEVEKLKQVIKTIPKGNGMVHGDYHPNNVMIDDEGELVLIDMADISRGNGFYDLGGSYLVFNFMCKIPLVRRYAKTITSISPKSCLRMWDIIMRTYFNTDDKNVLSKYEKQYRAFSNLRITTSIGMNTSHSALLTKIMVLYTKIFVLPKLDKYIELFSSIE